MLNFAGTQGTNDNDVVYTSQDISGEYIEHIFYQTEAGGAVTVQALVNGTWTADLAFEDMESTSPSTFVKTTSGTGLYRIIGKFEKIRFLQDGATASNIKGTHNP